MNSEKVIRLLWRKTIRSFSDGRKNEAAIGYRRCRYAHDADKIYGVVVNPKKSDNIIFDETDKIIVIAEE